MFNCENCNKELHDTIFVGDNEGGVYCDSDCYIEWYVEIYDIGYYTTVNNYKEYIRELEEKFTKVLSSGRKVKSYGRHGTFKSK